MNQAQTHIYEFGEFRVDASKRLLIKGENEQIPLTPKVFDTLLYLVEHSGKIIEKDELMSAVWTDTIVEENNLSQNISILRRILGEKRGEHRFIATIPGIGFKFVAEVTQIEEKKSEIFEIQDSELPITNQSGENKIPKTKAQKPKYLIFAAVILLLAVSAAVYFWRRETVKNAEVLPIKTIAVLPFKPLVAEQRDEALEIGMTDTLILKLSGGEINVRPLSSVRRYAALEQDSLSAGKALNVEAVLDGTIQISGDRIRIAARLFRVADGKQLWAERYDEKFNDIFAVQDSISEKVANALKIRLGNGEKKRYTENVEAYQLYMKGRFHSSKIILSETEKGIAYYNQAIAADPKYALAYAGIADAYRSLALTSDVPSNEVMPKGKAAALRAIELDDSLADAYAALGFITFFYDWDWQTAEKYCHRGLELDPNNADLRQAYAHLLSNTGRHAESLEQIKLSRELDPLNLRTNALEGQFLLHAGQTDAALDRLQKTIELDPDFWLTHLFMTSALIEKGQFEKAVGEGNEAKRLSPSQNWSIAFGGYALAKSGKEAEARKVLDELLKLSKTSYIPPYHFALIYNGLGENEKAIDYLEKGFAEKDVRMVFLKVEPKWNNLRNEPRFIDLVKRLNF